MTDLPFRMAPDPNFFLDASQFRSTLHALVHGLVRGDAFLVLTGDPGSGKTTVVRRLLAGVDRERFAVGEMLGSRLEGDELPQNIARALGVPLDAATDPLDALQRFLSQRGRDGRRALLVVDEAQDLPIEPLRWLVTFTSLRSAGQPVLQVCLVGHHEPRAVDELEQVGQGLEVGTSVRLRPLEAAETREYILHRLQCAGWTGLPAFDEAATDEIHALCQGVPRRINLLANRVLLEVYSQRADAASVELVRAVGSSLKAELAGQIMPTALPLGLSAPVLAEPAAWDEPADAAPDAPADQDLPEGALALADAPAVPAAPVDPLPVVLARFSAQLQRPVPGAAVLVPEPPPPVVPAPPPAADLSRRWWAAAVLLLVAAAGGVAGLWLSARPDGSRPAATAPAAPPATAALPAPPAAPVAQPAPATEPEVVARPAVALPPAPAASAPTPPGAPTPAPPLAPVAPAATRAPVTPQVVTLPPPAPKPTPPVLDQNLERLPPPSAGRPTVPRTPATSPRPVARSAAEPRAGAPSREPAREAEAAAPVAAPAPAPVTSCTSAAQSMGLCARAAPAPAAAPREPVREAPREAPREAAPRPACEPARQALGLCADR